MSNWIEVGSLKDIPKLGARVIKTQQGDIAIFRASDDQVFALKDSCPHKQGPLSQGIVHGHTVTCLLHNWNINLENGEALGPDEGCTGHYATKLEGDTIFLSLENA